MDTFCSLYLLVQNTDMTLSTCRDLVVWFGFSRFLFWYEAVHTAVWTLPVVTSAFEEMRLAQSFIGTISIIKAEPVFSAKYCFCVYTWNIPSADCRNGSGGSSWEDGAAPSSSSSCSVPICIPEYWLSLPSSTLWTDTKSKHLQRGN